MVIRPNPQRSAQDLSKPIQDAGVEGTKTASTAEHFITEAKKLTPSALSALLRVRAGLSCSGQC